MGTVKKWIGHISSADEVYIQEESFRENITKSLYGCSSKAAERENAEMMKDEVILEVKNGEKSVTIRIRL